ncbi:multicopper oxidase family protein [Brevibacillus agri]|uniref:multicopper oxidase family protein n=1 Tax=Brevibacillus TaxID=55080 RepID=UPI002E1D1A66|nr:multicopper oxidase family protein [Brevibacillus agri]MED1657507.1 multicopper oxidase family protein [Brevibacillus agri]MED1690105.1 multicopper oxidase family protein [Brevibacillus agri]MED1694421.1 multicopper oxidase family protein [Brevibacillus agri]MED1700283.1 multicopper oxidase family protein [Brevibacillus agri]
MVNRKHKKKWIALPILLTGALVLSACSNNTSNNMEGHDMSSMGSMNAKANEQPKQMSASADPKFQVLTGNTFTLTAKESMLMLDDDTMKTAWTYNGTVPGPQLRVKQGETIKVVLNNELPEPVTIHWHGLPVPNNMDGIPGVTQNAVKPNESFTYEFKVDVPGTYWYHSHQDSNNQVDKGLYGSIVVEPKESQPVDKDYTIVLDEWMEDDSMAAMHGGGGPETKQSGGNSSNPDMDMGGMDHGTMNMGNGSDTNSTGMDMSGMSDAEMMPLMYNIFAANGKTGSAIEPLGVKEGEKVRIRLINAGYLSHKLHLPGHEFKIVSTDGQPINNPPAISGQLLNIAPGERYDIEFVANNPGKWLLDEHSMNPGAKSLAIPIVYEGSEQASPKTDSGDMPVVDMTKYGEAAKSNFSLDDQYDVEYTMDLGTDRNNGTFTINGKTFPDTPPINVKEGDLVKVKLVNNSPEDVHPMHLHGHFFQVLSKNGQPVSGSPLVKDTLNILPGEEYVVAFQADNAGNWMFHCHDLGHASKGMVTQVLYDGFKPDFTIDPSANNKPE